MSNLSKRPDSYYLPNYSPPISCHNKRNKAGFTLLGLIVVILLITLILALSTAFFANTLPSSRFNATVREVAATIKQAKNLARSSGRRQIITIDLDSGDYGIDGRIIKAIPSDINIKVLDNISGEVITGKYRLIFYRTGASEGGIVILWNEKKRTAIEIDPIIGAVIREQV